MKKEKTAPGTAGLKLLLLTISLAGLPQPSLASVHLEDTASVGGLVEDVRMPPSLGGVSLERFQPWRSAVGYQPDLVSMSYTIDDAQAGVAPAPANVGIDPIKTATIIPGVFGSVALSMHNFPVAARWAPVYQAIVGCSAGSACEQKSAAFARLISSAQGKGFSEKLSFVNSGINHLIAYRKDSVIYGKLDYWAKPTEVLDKRAGDCEDFVILKMTALLRAGIPAQSMALVVLQDRRRGFFHAVLSVSTASGVFILDSLNNTVLRDSDLPDYVPLYSFSTDRAWIHGSRSGSAQVAEIKGGFAGVAPGEGLQPDTASGALARR
ncbi:MULTISPECIES: transglutaminase-like cysteine peptidase [unclassified Mesorhizobium]|uniref:transglutaminase-like cysteine peptidase n=1 Tax=unclassified Mesorhizobium TaxID=325217 RepID=UPI00112D8518|nr:MULTISPECIES: transglutaminase-like cysteine peptidase [unclassified Mesorhizobium]TPI47817.1 transglutaminase [Mesorhizobium sp. B3-1-1]TPJ62663.1 transglutaminase [Mesorhizobium sp. B2-6-7]TPJ79437.1 transglutaminase [Mesorhizobium sp. B2-6-3]TPJ92809.1 transglutaminase [Mesorhizobium sp. B2-5-10]TPK07180.1 transglutaminase [Mesorhizobium sp. B2-5-11]